MRKRLFVVCWFLAVSACAQTIAIRAGNLIDPATGMVAKDQIILVKDQKIQAVGPAIAIPKDAQIVDLSKEMGDARDHGRAYARDPEREVFPGTGSQLPD